MRRYPTLFKEFPHTRYASLPCFKLTDTAMFLDQQEQNVYETHELECIERLCKVLMMVKSRDGLPLKYVYPLKWDLGLPFEFHKTLVEKYPEHLRVVKTKNGVLSLRLEQWRDELAVSALQKRYESAEFKRGREALSFPMNFPKGYGREKKVQSWMDCFQKLPYISPYEDSSKIDPNSDLMEKRVVAVLHELLSLTIHKKTKRNYLTCLIDELNLPDKFTRVFTRYPGIFYLSMKCKTTTITLKEAYERGKLVDPHPLSRVRDKFYYVMRAGIMYRGKKVDFIPDKDFLVNYKENGSEQEESEEEEEVDMEMWSESDDE
ncbi:hypothetical protein GIB67_008246 [Kingdonia uniflora]|uniref:PORR domain-containing protein n=1 Tax=Kingdonia uniflora TaxID=39325 RepID=A0A7J7N4R8_9MAGN|nr:hypothetical protein GIB67_008246 [Kingdonia uniflora]